MPETLSPKGRGEKKTDREKRQFIKACDGIARFNRDVTALGDRVEPAERVLKGLLGDGANRALVHPSLVRLAEVRSGASALSRTDAARVSRLYALLFGLIFLAVLFFHGYAHLFAVEGGHNIHEPAYLWAFVGCLLGAFAIVVLVHLFRVERRALDYRAVGEALRVQFYWGAAGVDDSVASSYLDQVRSEMSWVRHVVRALAPRTWELRDFFRALPSAQQDEVFGRINQEWLQGQRDWYEKRRREYHRTNLRLRIGGWVMAVAGWLLAVGLVAGLVDARHPDHVLLIVSGQLVVAGGLLIAFNERRLYEELARRFDGMHVLFGHGVTAFASHLARRDTETAQDLLKELGNEALSENAHWLLLRRARPFELPVH